jgi:chitinase
MRGPCGETSKTITVLVYGDTIKEKSETFYVNLNNFWGATLGTKSGLGTILNDD